LSNRFAKPLADRVVHPTLELFAQTVPQNVCETLGIELARPAFLDCIAQLGRQPFTERLPHALADSDLQPIAHSLCHPGADRLPRALGDCCGQVLSLPAVRASVHETTWPSARPTFPLFMYRVDCRLQHGLPRADGARPPRYSL